MTRKADKDPYEKPTLEVFSMSELVPDMVLACTAGSSQTTNACITTSPLGAEDLDFKLPAA